MAASSSQDLHEILRRGLHAVYQPVVDLEREDVVGYEALVRGNSTLSTPAELFAAAASAGMITELDWACRAAAIQGALEGGLRPPASLFINAEPSTLGVPVPEELVMLHRRAANDLKIIVEVSEQHLLDAPSAMLDKLEKVRDLGWGIALDDVGRDLSSVALLALVRPDVVKISPHLVQEPLTPSTMRIVRAIGSYARESGAQLIAEGVETDEHLVRARAIGARLAQGHRYGSPSDLPREASRRRCGAIRIPRIPPIGNETPLEVVTATGLPMHTCTEEELQNMMLNLEDQLAGATAPGIVMSCLQQSERLTPQMAERYGRLADLPALVHVFGWEMPENLGHNVHGVNVPIGHQLNRERVSILITPSFSGMVVAQARERQRGWYDYVVTDDRSIVIRAARALARSIVRFT